MNKMHALFDVKALDGGDSNGEFLAVLSVPVVDRDGEMVAPGAFARAPGGLPSEIPVHAFHNFSAPVATAWPYYDGDVLKARGVFDPDPESQRIRAKVGRSIRYMSVGFMAAVKERRDDGVPVIVSAELLEASLVSVPSNREAAILAVKAASHRTPSAATVGEAKRMAAEAKRLLAEMDAAELARLDADLAAIQAACERHAKAAPPPPRNLYEAWVERKERR